MKKKNRFFATVSCLCVCVVAMLGVCFGFDALTKQVYPQKYDDIVQQYATEYNVDELLVYTIIRTESGFNPSATSNVNAKGLMQITEETFDWIKSKIAPKEDLIFVDLYIPEVNIRFGTYFLSVCMQKYQQDVKTAAAAYHSGMGTVDGLLKDLRYSHDGKVLDVFPYDQMYHYVEKVSRNYQIYQSLYENN